MVTFVASATAINPATTSVSSLTVNKPTGTLNGHLMVMIVSCSAAQTLTTPTGWTLVQGPFDSNTGCRSYLFKKIAASEGTNYTLTFVNSEACSVSIATFSGASDIVDYSVLNNDTFDPTTGETLYPPTESLGYHVVAWRDTTINTASASGYTEAFDIGALGTGSVNARGQAGYYNTSGAVAYGAVSYPTIDITNSVTASILWDIAIGTTVPTNESWNATGNSVEIQSGSTFIDVTNDVQYSEGINITRGTTSQGGQVNPSVASFTLDNRSGNYSPRNPLGTFYGVGYNTQCRISKTFGDINYQTPGFDNISYLETGSSRVRAISNSSLNITGDIDLRIECEPESWNQEQVLLSKWALPAVVDDGFALKTASWMFYLNSIGTLSFTWDDGGVDPALSTHTVTSTAVVPTVIRQYLRVTMDVNNGASGSTATFYTSTDGSSWTQLGNTVVSTGTTVIGASVAPVNIGAMEPGVTEFGSITNFKEFGPSNPFGFEDFTFFAPVVNSFVGKIYNASIRNGIAGTVVASPTFTSATNGSYSLTDSQSNLWIVIGPGVFTNRHYRHHGEITSWPQPRDSTGNFAWVDIESSGALQRETQGTEEDTSLFYQHYTNPDGIRQIQTDSGYYISNGPFYPHAYWPCEDGADSDAPTSALSGGIDAEVDGAIEFAAIDFNPSSKPIMKIENGTSVKFPTPHSTSGSYAVEFVLYAPSGMTVPSDILHIQTTGADAMLRLVYSGTNQISASIYDSQGTLLDNFSFQAALISERKVKILISSDSGGISFATMVMGDRFSTDVGSSLNNGTATTGRITAVFLEPNHADGVYVGHVAVFDGESSAQPLVEYSLNQVRNDPLNGLIGESADRRTKRIVEYREMLPYIIGDNGKRMGRQYPDVPMGTVRMVQESDDGYVYEPRNFLGLGYRTIGSMYNTAPILELDYSNGELSGTFLPLIDNQGVANDVTVNNVNLGSQRYVKTSGVNNINRPPTGAGRYSSSVDASLGRTSDALNQAAWRVFIGTNDELKVDTVTVALENGNFNDGNDAIQRFLTADIGDSMTIDNLPDLLMPDQMRQLIVGYTETFDQFQHSITFNTVPGSSYQPLELTAAATSTTQPKAGSDSTTLNEDLTTTETLVDVAITSGKALWTTSGVDFDIMIGGERMTVTSVSGSSSPQTFTCVRSVNGVVKTHSTGASVKLFKPRHAGL